MARVTLPVTVELRYCGQPLVVNLANVLYVSTLPDSKITGVWFTNGDSHVIDQSPSEFNEIADRALTEAQS